MDVDDPQKVERRTKKFHGFNHEDKVLTITSVARVFMFIHKEIKSERLIDLKNRINSTIIIRERRRTNKRSYIIGNYRK